jgi:hypothetical protein
MAQLRHYDAKSVTVSLAGINVQGFADGEFVTIQQEANDFEDVVGSDGEVSRAPTNDNRATVTFVLMQTSPTNQLLSALLRLDKATPGGAGVGALIIRNRLSGGEIYRANHAWIQKPPDVSMDRGPTPRTWTIRANLSDRTD